METMEAGEASSSSDRPYMVSSLPLIFCEGRPMDIDNLSERGLVNFVRFMLKCALGVNETQLRLVKRPSWWPRTMPYVNFKARSEVEKGHSARLRDLVRCCYRGNRCEFLLQFCADLEDHCASGRMIFKNNFDGTSSLIERASNQLVVTCRNENLEYDRPAMGATSPRRHLMPRPAGGRRASSQLAMVQPPTVQEIYLCDHCSAEFTSISQVKEHERQCGPGGDGGAADSDSDGESVSSELEEARSDQTRYLSYVGLRPAAGTGKQPYWSPSKQRGGGGRQRRVICALRGVPAVDLTSPLGVRLASGAADAPSVTQNRDEAERYCDTGERKRSGRQPTFPVTWRPLRKRGRLVQRWTHLVSFTPHQRAERLCTIRTGLTARSRRLLRAAAVPCSVRLCRLSEAEITDACTLKTPPAPTPAAWTPPATLQGRLFLSAADAGLTAGRAPTVADTDPVNGGQERAGGPSRPRSSATGTPRWAVPGGAAAGPARDSVDRGGTDARVGCQGGSVAGAGYPGVARRGGGVQRVTGHHSRPPETVTRPITRPAAGAVTVPFARFQPPVKRPGYPFQAARARAHIDCSRGRSRTVRRVRAGTGVTVIPVAPPGAGARRHGLGPGAAQQLPTRPAPAPKTVSAEPIMIDLCSSSDEEDAAAPAVVPLVAPVVPKRELTEAAAASATNGTHQSKNARSHWSVSWGGSANGGCSDTPSLRMRRAAPAGRQHCGWARNMTIRRLGVKTRPKPGVSAW